MKVLILEDDPLSQQVLVETLEHTGHACRATDKVDEAFRLLEEEGGFHAVLCDIHLPGIQGMDHIQRLCAEYPLLVTIVITGFPSLETCLEALQLGATNYLVKPFRATDVIEMLERGHKERTLRSEVDNLKERIRELEQRLKGGRNE